VKDVWTEALGEDQEKENWYLHMLAVQPEYQGKGIAKTLVKYVTDMVRRVVFQVLRVGGSGWEKVFFDYFYGEAECCDL
jgi:GNAT superfamily N-acetyltransferase